VKACFKCQRVKPMEQFYRHAMMADGHLGKCKACTRADVAAHRAANLARRREYDRQRSSEPQRRELARRIMLAFRARHPERIKAQRKVRYEVKKGRLARPATCQWCANDGRVEGHHNDYAKPLDVLWLCKPCHAIADRERRQSEVAA
jgi:hypothetical protein